MKRGWGLFMVLLFAALIFKDLELEKEQTRDRQISVRNMCYNMVLLGSVSRSEYLISVKDFDDCVK